MSQTKPTVDELAQRIDQLLMILRDISEDLADISKHLKAREFPATPSAVSPTLPAQAAPQVAPVPRGRLRSVAEITEVFPKEFENMLYFEETEKYIIIKPRQYLGSENFAKIASLVRSAGGEYISAGKESHFRIPKEAR